jgi:hypothetical protein
MSTTFVNEVAKLTQTAERHSVGTAERAIFGEMKKVLLLLVFLCGLGALESKAQFETVKDSVVQLYGVVMTADSLQGIPAVSVMVKGQNRGTITNGQGIFSIVVLKGDEVEFSHVSYKSKTITVPRDIAGNQYSVAQLLVEDTIYLPATIIKARPTPQQFSRDFVNSRVPDDDIEIARQNNDVAKRRILMQNTPADGGEATSLQFRNLANRATYAGQLPPQKIFDPAAWAEFIKAWKRGDFKRKKD